jgi:hypothetical protein
VLKPIRNLNSRLRTIIKSKDKTSIISVRQQVSKEITDLYDLCETIMKTNKFQNNDFMTKTEEMAIIDLAEACIIFEENEN